ncbi:hypothetical protein CR513_21186, partial [Mucuna pruriens]
MAPKLKHSMDIIFELQRGKSFTIEIGYYDTVLEMKEKVQKYHNIPVSKQTLILNGQVLQDSDDPWKIEIFHNTRLQLQLSPDKDDNKDLVTSSPLVKIQLNVKAASKTHVVPLEVDVNDTVLRLKERIHEMEAVAAPVNRLLLHSSTAVELQDHQLLRDCDVSENTEIDVSFRPSPTASPGSKKLKLMVLPKSGTKKVPVEVNASDNVGELRKELQKLHQRVQFHLPQDGYFFIYKQNVMDDDRSFRWHHVTQGDTIEIFNGSNEEKTKAILKILATFVKDTYRIEM